MKSALSIHVLLTTSLLGMESESTQKKPSLSSWNLSSTDARKLSRSDHAYGLASSEVSEALHLIVNSPGRLRTGGAAMLKEASATNGCGQHKLDAACWTASHCDVAESWGDALVACAGCCKPGGGQGALHGGERVRVEVLQPVVARVRHAGRPEQLVVQARLDARRLAPRRRLAHPRQHALRQRMPALSGSDMDLTGVVTSMPSMHRLTSIGAAVQCMAPLPKWRFSTYSSGGCSQSLSRGQ